MPCKSCGFVDITCCHAVAIGRSEFICSACKTMLGKAIEIRPNGHFTSWEMCVFPPFLCVNATYIQKLYMEVN